MSDACNYQFIFRKKCPVSLEVKACYTLYMKKLLATLISFYSFSSFAFTTSLAYQNHSGKTLWGDSDGIDNGFFYSGSEMELGLMFETESLLYGLKYKKGQKETKNSISSLSDEQYNYDETKVYLGYQGGMYYLALNIFKLNDHAFYLENSTHKTEEASISGYGLAFGVKSDGIVYEFSYDMGGENSFGPYDLKFLRYINDITLWFGKTFRYGVKASYTSYAHDGNYTIDDSRVSLGLVGAYSF